MKRSGNYLHSVSKINHQGWIFVNFTGADRTAVTKLVKQWKNKDEVLYSGVGFIDKTGNEMAALTNRIIVRLKQQSATSL